VWKNLLCLRRTFQLRVFIAPIILSVTWGWAMGAGKGVVAGIAIGCASFAGVLTFFGPMLVRNDLRQDMQNLIALKTLPLSGRNVVMAEVLSSALPVAVAQYLVLIVGCRSGRSWWPCRTAHPCSFRVGSGSAPSSAAAWRISARA